MRLYWVFSVFFCLLFCYYKFLIFIDLVFLQVHDEKEMDRVLGIEGIELIGINNRNLGMCGEMI